MNLKEIKELIELLKDTDVAEIEIEKAGTRVRVKKGNHEAGNHPAVTYTVQAQPAPGNSPAPQAALPASAPASQAGEEAGESNVVVVTSPIVGTFYRSPSPDAAVYVEVGDVVKKGQVICIIEAMKLMNEIEAEVSGKIVGILAENAQPVEYGEPLFKIEPA